VAALAAVSFLAAQLVRPKLPAPPVTGNIRVSPPVEQILRTSCYNCHSNETRLPWFDQIVPAYWIAVADVKRAREHVNFSEFDKAPEAQQRGILFESVSQMESGLMPLKRYELVHPESRVSPDALATLKQYLVSSGRNTPAATPQQESAVAQQYDAWRTRRTRGEVRPAPNGLAFLPDYRNWSAISTTERFDNNTLRVILANEVAVAAIRDQRINPWPDGVAFAKVAWNQLADAAGQLRPGTFVQVEFMVKDARKYASTKGWGWGRWKGADLQPYGSSPDFTAECTGCHTPMRNNDYVFTTPIQAIDGLPHQPLQWKVITSSVDRGDGTMATLYGNDTAVQHARESPDSAYPAGSVLSLVTWAQRADEHWFGARIPGGLRTVEFVTAGATPQAASYLRYSGSPLQSVTPAPETRDSRIRAILGQRASLMP
jgi:hypothetical protein